MGFLEYHFLDLEKTHLCGVLVLLQLHGDVLDVRFQIGDHHVLKSVDAAAGLFDLLRQQLHGLFDAGQLQHVLKHGADGLHGNVQLAAGLREAVGVDLRWVIALGLEAVDRHVHRHDVLKLHAELHALPRVEERLLQHLGRHDGACHLQRGKRLGEAALHALAQDLVAADHVHELAHQLVALIL